MVINPKFSRATSGGRSYFVLERSRLRAAFDLYAGDIDDMITRGRR